MLNARFTRAARRASIVAAAVAAAAAVHVSTAPAAASKQLNITMTDFKIKPAHTRVGHGKVTFVVHNRSAMEHEMVVIKTGRNAAKLPMHGGRASENGSVGEVEDIGGGKTKRLTLSLKKGHYALICNVPGHYQAGMHADLTVR